MTNGLGPKVFSKLSKTGQPAFAAWVTGGIALLAIFLGATTDFTFCKKHPESTFFGKAWFSNK